MLSITLKRIRKNRGLSQQQVADALNVDRSTYAYYEIGKTRPDVNSILKLSKIFDIPYTEILGEEDTTPRHCLNDFDVDLYGRLNLPEVTEEMYQLPKSEKSLLCLYRVLPQEEKDKILEEVLKKAHENNQNEN